MIEWLADWTIAPPNMWTPVALALVALLGYLVGRRSLGCTELPMETARRAVERAQSVAEELDKIADSVRRNLSQHQSSVARFRERLDGLTEAEKEAAWRTLCAEAEEILGPTMQLARQIASAYDDLRQQSTYLMEFSEVRRDPLTGVRNRRGLDETLESLVAMKTRYEQGFSIVVLDIDHFKRINDELGHLTGDRALKDVAALLDENVRQTDLLARYGGEEFVIVMPLTDLAGAGLFAERLRLRVAQLALSGVRLTVSGGVAEAIEGEIAESILQRADEALYRAKAAGRNCIFQHTGTQIEQVAEAELLPAG